MKRKDSPLEKAAMRWWNAPTKLRFDQVKTDNALAKACARHAKKGKKK